MKIFRLFLVFLFSFGFHIDQSLGLGGPGDPKEEQGVRWVTYVPSNIEQHLVSMAREEKLTRENFLNIKEPPTSPQEKTTENSVNLVSMTILCYPEGSSNPIEFPISHTEYSVGLERPATKRIFCASNDHPFNRFQSHSQTYPQSIVLGLESPNSADELNDYKNKLEQAKKSLENPLKNLLPKFQDPQSPTPITLEDFRNIFQNLEELIGNLVPDQSAQERDETVKKMKEAISNHVQRRLSAEYLVETQNVSSGILEGLSKQKSHSLDSEQYLLYRLNTKLNDPYDACFDLTEILKGFNTASRIDKVLILLHSTYDMCTKCSVSMAREYAAQGGVFSTIDQLVQKHNQGIKPQLSILVASSLDYQEHGTSPRRYLNYQQGEDCSNEETFFQRLKEFSEKKLIMQWAIPTYKITPMPTIPPDSQDSDDRLDMSFM